VSHFSGSLRYDFYMFLRRRLKNSHVYGAFNLDEGLAPLSVREGVTGLARASVALHLSYCGSLQSCCWSVTALCAIQNGLGVCVHLT